MPDRGPPIDVVGPVGGFRWPITGWGTVWATKPRGGRHYPGVRRFHRPNRVLLGPCLVLLGSCTGDITGPAQLSGDTAESGNSPFYRGGPSEADPGPAPAAQAGQGAGAGAGAPQPQQALDVGFVGLHRLNNEEYDYTVRDLLGVPASPARSFITSEKAAGFDNIASALGITAARYEQYFQAADSLVEEVWADATLRGRIMTCTPGVEAGDTCTREILSAFGLRAYRRPLQDDELARLLGVVRAAVGFGESPQQALGLAVKTALSSPAFLYRAELDPDPNSELAHPLGPYELASRLSYLLWSTMPDARLFELAQDGSLVEAATLRSEVTRMLRDPRSSRFVDRFAGQWLGLRALVAHQVDRAIFPQWDEALREAMIREGLAYFELFLRGDRGMDEFFTAEVSFVDSQLAELYGYAGSSFDPATPLEVTGDARRGFLGLASFLTLSSFSYRTAPTLRGKWVLENLLCTGIAPPPANVPELDEESADPAALASQNVRERLAAHRENPGCAACHELLDPIGFGLERFDGIGAYRQRYNNGDAIDASGSLPDGSPFDGLQELSSLLADDPRLLDCTTEKLLTYALGRELGAPDMPQVAAIVDGWQRDGLGLGALVERVVLSDAFRMRRGESGP